MIVSLMIATKTIEIDGKIPHYIKYMQQIQ